MPTTLTLKNIPDEDEVYERLKASAGTHRHSEAIVCLGMYGSLYYPLDGTVYANGVGGRSMQRASMFTLLIPVCVLVK